MTERGHVTRVSQECETPGQMVRRSAFSYRYAYARSSDNQMGGERGQDYLVLREDQQRLAFALCDGVSQSFFGDLAARSVGNALVEWLWDNRELPDDASALQDRLRQVLQRLTVVVAVQVRGLSLPDHLPAMVREVLERKRTLGTQTTFVTGLIDIARGWLWLAWMGDSRIRLWDREGDEQTHEFDNLFRTAERWSSDRGVLGDIHVLGMPLRKVSRLVAHSDGLQSVAGLLSRSVGDDVLNGLIARAVESSASDDVSYLEVWLGATSSVEGDTVPRLAQMKEPSAAAASAGVPSEGVRPGQQSAAATPLGGGARRIRPAWIVPIAVAGGILCMAAAVGTSRLMLVRGLFNAPTPSVPTHVATVVPPPIVATASGTAAPPVRSPPPMPTATPAPSLTPLPAPTETPSRTPHAAWSPSLTPRPTATSTPTRTPSPSPVPTTTPMFTWTPVPSPTTTPMLTWTPTSTPTPTWTVTSASTPTSAWTATATSPSASTPTKASVSPGEPASALSPTPRALDTEPASWGGGEGGEFSED